MALHLVRQVTGALPNGKLGFQLTVHLLILGIPLQYIPGHTAGDQAGEINAAKQLLLIGLLGEQPLKLPRAGNAAAESVDRVALGLSRLTQDEQVLPGEQGNGDTLHQFLTLRNPGVHISNNRQHTVQQDCGLFFHGPAPLTPPGGRRMSARRRRPGR